MQKKYKITLFVLILLLIGTISCFIHYSFHKSSNAINEYAEVFVEENLSFNFLEGKEIETKEKEKIYHFSIINTSNEPTYYSINLERTNSKNAEYELFSDQENFQSIQKNYPNGHDEIIKSMEIQGNTTHSYILKIKNKEQEKVIGTIAIQIEKDMNNFANVILKNNEVHGAAQTIVGENAAVTEEGLIESTDDDGKSYYFRGKTENNYVSFANLLWRIVKVNGDGTVKLVLNQLINNSTQFYAQDSNYNLSFQEANILNILKVWYQSNLENYDSFIANSKFCSDTSYDENGFLTLTRIYTNHNAIFECLIEPTSSKIGLLSADEVALAGGSNHSPNTEYYLYNSEINTSWWTLSPAKNNHGNFYYIETDQNGEMNEGTLGTLFRGNRPVINLIKKTTVTGVGTKEDPYVVNNP